MKKLRYPVIATLKKDGIRAVKLGDLASRTLKKIPNQLLQNRSDGLPYGFDMELWNPDLPYDQVESIVMSKEHPDSGKIQFHVLDWWDQGRDIPYKDRMATALFEKPSLPSYCILPQLIECRTPHELLAIFHEHEELQGEGICFRLPDSPYKQGRSTLKEQYLVKLARFSRSECEVIGFEEQMFNGNPIRRNAVGKMDRSSAGANLIGKGVLGAFLVRSKEGLEFRVGTGVGLTDKKRGEIWADRESWLGTQIVIKSKGHGVKTKPRSPIYVGRRNEIDI
jgi:DNA ligase-1